MVIENAKNVVLMVSIFFKSSSTLSKQQDLYRNNANFLCLELYLSENQNIIFASYVLGANSKKLYALFSKKNTTFLCIEQSTLSSHETNSGSGPPGGVVLSVNSLSWSEAKENVCSLKPLPQIFHILEPFGGLSIVFLVYCFSVISWKHLYKQRVVKDVSQYRIL